MVLGVLGEWGQRRRAATVMGPVMGQKPFRPCAARTASGAASGGRKSSSFEKASGLHDASCRPHKKREFLP